MQAFNLKTVLHISKWSSFCGFLLLLLISGAFTTKLNAQCSGSVDLGNDTAIAFCTGAGLWLDLPGWDTYLWSTGSTDPNEWISSPGDYWLTVTENTGNIVVNGDFEAGATGFTSGYAYSTNLYPEGTYWVGVNPTTVHPDFVGADHTTGTGNFLVVNGSGTPGSAVWCQTVAVDPGTDYDFSAWVSTMVVGSPALLQFEINGALIGPVFTAPATTLSWEQFSATWNSGTATTADICIINQNVSLSGNDFGIDDISLSTICEYTDSIFVNDLEWPMAIAPWLPTEACAGDTLTFSALASGGYGTLVYTWADSTIGTDITVVPTTDTVFTVTVTDDCGNSISGDAVVNIYAPVISVDYSLTDCGTFQFINLGEPSQTYDWDFGDNFTSDLFEPEHTFQVLGDFDVQIFTVDTFGCPNDTVFSVNVSADILAVPNAFTPNGDELNDRFRPIPGCDAFSAEGYRFEVFNRWGTLLFSTDDPLEGWDGNFLEAPQEFGAYVWQLQFNKWTSSGPELQHRSGSVTLMR